MIQPGADLELKRIPLHQLHVYENQQRYPDRLMHYIGLLTRHDGDPGVIAVKPRGNGYEILDGHHRYCALIITGREDALCLVIDEDTEARQEHAIRTP
jgi:hypothetical protein